MVGCTFSIQNENINPIEPPEPISVFIEVNDVNFNDPYYLIFSTYFNFTIKELTNPIIGYEVFMDNEQIDSGNDNFISFSLFPHAYSDGTHKVTIRITIETQSGSLAEKVGAEFYLVEKSFIIIIDRTPPESVSPPTASYKNGFLTVQWNAPKQSNFAYVLKRRYEPYYPLRDSLINNPSQNYFVEPGYVGGEIKYEIRVVGFGFDNLMGEVIFNEPPFNYEFTIDDQNVVHFSWENLKIDTAKTKLSISSGLTTYLEPLNFNGNISLDTLKLGDQLYYRIIIERENYYFQRYYKVEILNTLPNIKNFTDFAILPQSKKLLIVNNEKVYRYSLPSFTVEDSLSFEQTGTGQFTHMAISQNETQGVLVGSLPGIIEFDPFDFSLLKEIDIYDATISATRNNQLVQKIRIGNLSNNGLLSIRLTKNKTWAMVFDINTNTVKWISSYFTNYSTTAPPVISNDGTYFAFDRPGNTSGKVFNLIDQDYTLIGRTELGNKYFRNLENELINLSIIDPIRTPINPTIGIYNLKSPPLENQELFSKAREFIIPDPDSPVHLIGLSYDDATESLITRYDDGWHSDLTLLDVVDFRKTQNMKAYQSNKELHGYSSDFHLISTGYIEKVK